MNHDRGHVFGDRILKYIAEKLRQNTKDMDDVIARVGGDEFLLFMFKKVNHDRGHVFGDRILKYIAEKLRQNTKDMDDVIARVGGDEFLLFMKEDQEISNIIQNIFSSIQGDLDGFQIMINMGIVSTKQVERDFDILIRCADLALFDAKKKENKGFSYYEETMKDHEFSSISCIDHM